MKHPLIAYILAGAMGSLAAFGCNGGTAAATSGAVQAEVQPAAAVAGVPAFSADSAFAYVCAQVDFGPRVPGSAAHRNCADWIVTELTRHGADTVIQQTATLPETGPIRNIMGRFDASNPERILLLAHYDTRPWADEDPNPDNRNKPIDGANDGASGVGVLLELARLIGEKSPGVGIDILLVDAEDSGNSGDDSSWALGTQYFAKNMTYGSTEPLPSSAILLDMVGGKNAVFNRELFSQQYASQVVNQVWKAARQAGHEKRFPNSLGGAVNDDHLPLLGAGIPAIDIIETNNPVAGSFCPTWHTMADNKENIDPNSLKAVGETVATYIYSLKK